MSAAPAVRSRCVPGMLLIAGAALFAAESRSSHLHAETSAVHDSGEHFRSQ